MGLRLRLFFVLIVPLILVVGIYGAVRVRQDAEQLDEAEEKNAATAAKAIQIAVENALRDRQGTDLRRLLAEMVDGQDQVGRIRLFDLALRPTFSSDADGMTTPVPAQRLGRVLERGRPETYAEERWNERTLVYLLPLRGRANDLRGVLEIVFPGTATDAKVLKAARHALLGIGLLTLAVALLTTLVLQRHVLRPLSRLTRSIRALGEGRAGAPLPVTRPDELGAVAEAFNRMAEQLEAGRQRLVNESEHALELEQQLRQAETLAVAGKLASGIAHEVGTPLNIISGRAEILLRALPGDHSGRPDLDVIIGQIDRISAIIRSLMDTVRLQKPEIQQVALPPLLERLVHLLDYMARRRGVTLGTKLTEDLPDVAADPGQVQQVLLNLLMNALEATPRDGAITVEAWACPHDGRPGAAVAVSDTGTGISPDSLGRIFDPFYTTKPPGQGTGLGLAIARDIVRDHGGTLAVQSRAGVGTTFTLWLPQHEISA
jgi:signal transduction histidine kinase